MLDRSYSSTAAYTLGAPPTVSQDELPPAAWRWPRDLRQPDLALLLEAGPAVRQARIEARAGGVGIGIGEWERRVKGDPSLGENIHAAYRRLQLERRVRGSRRDAETSGGAHAGSRGLPNHRELRPRPTGSPTVRPLLAVKVNP